MKWGFFTPVHIATLVLATLILGGLYHGLKNKSQRVQTLVLLPLSCSGIAAIVYNLLRWGEPLAYLPLHLCSLNALILPIAVATRNKKLCNLLLLWCLGALVALVANFEMMNTEVFGEAFNFYFFPHVFEFGIPVLIFKLKLVEKDPMCIGTTLSTTMFLYSFVHLCNLVINRYCASIGSALRVNYMFSVEATNPLTALFYKLIPHDYWYMYLIIPIVAAYLLVVYAPELAAKYLPARTHSHTTA
jgi:uncharacterized membrane protein YwaF